MIWVSEVFLLLFLGFLLTPIFLIVFCPVLSAFADGAGARVFGAPRNPSARWAAEDQQEAWLRGFDYVDSNI